MKKSIWGRLSLAITGILTIAATSNIVPPKYAALAALGLSIFQSFTHPVTQSTEENKLVSQVLEVKKVEDAKA